MGIRFADIYIAEMRPALTIEDVYKHLSSYGGIHSFSFDSLLECVPTFDALEWDTTGGSWTFGASAFTGTPDGSGGFEIAWWEGNGGDPADNKNLFHSVVFEVDIAAGCKNAVIAFRNNGLGDYYLVWVSETSAAFYKVEGNVPALIEDVPYGVTDPFTGPASLRLAIRQQMFSEYDVDRWLFMSLWLDDRLILSSRDHLPTSIPGLMWGLGYENSTVGLTADYTYVRVPDMTEIIPWASIDPGEAPLQGIQRAIADRVIKSFIRYDGTLRAWRPKPSAVMQVFTPSEENFFATEHNFRELYNHVRLYYALDWVEAFDSSLYHPFGHRFIEMTNTWIEDMDEAYREALAILRRLKEESIRSQFRTKSGGVLLEPEDRVTMPDESDYIVDSLTLDYANRGLVVSMQARQYSWGS